MLVIPEESLQVHRVVASAMSRHTFALVQPSQRLVENQEIATGVGVKWKGQYLILTAGHVVDYCPEDTLRFFLPARHIQFAPQEPRPTLSVEFRGLVELRQPRPPVFADDPVDLAAIILPPQPGAEECFAALDPGATMPVDGTQVGVFGYPGATKIPLGKNYMASPEHFLERWTRRAPHAGMSRSRISPFLTNCRTAPTATAAAASGISRRSRSGHHNRACAAFSPPNAPPTKSFQDTAPGRL
jgi:hypothetical protein